MFNSLLVESFLESVDFGEVVLRFLELNTAVKLEEIAEKPEVFVEEIEDLYGDSAPLIEERIIRKLCSKLGMEFGVVADRKFPEQVREALRRYLEKTRRSKGSMVAPKESKN